jgi:putative membrane protein
VKLEAFMLSAALAVPMTVAAQTGKMPSNAVANNTSQLTRKDKLFLHTIASEDQSEIDLAKLALQKSSDPKVQQYARSKILAADPSMEQQARQIAQQKHTSISCSPNPAAKLRYKQLSNFSGKQFEQAYVKYEARQQAADFKVVKFEAASASSAEVRGYAQKEQTPVQQAAESANKLAKAMNISTIS